MQAPAVLEKLRPKEIPQGIFFLSKLQVLYLGLVLDFPRNANLKQGSRFWDEIY
ncbi:hypothetical protein LEP1GSC061_1693 [Leptospira wolffii serovar Khorat str. Khorat-H2]|nr:hypothetical protein LEP1GSC061_1693 [Leptospira wolffii serovar Khorat str. Khorat-H2]